MTVPTIFETCRPRADVLAGTITESDFAADLAQVIKEEAGGEYLDPGRFFANTYPTRGLRNLLANVCRRLTGAGGEAASIFRLDTSYGGGKTHGLIALRHAALGMQGVSDVSEFVDPSLLPHGPVRVAAYDGENADPTNGRAMGGGIFARTPWGEIGYALAGRTGYERVRKSDESRIAPGAETLRGLFGGEPTLILLDELSVYLRKVRSIEDARYQMTAFLTSLFKAVESAPNAILVLYPGHRQVRPRHRRLHRREPVHRRSDGGSGERFRSQGDALEPHRGGREQSRFCAGDCSSRLTRPGFRPSSMPTGVSGWPTENPCPAMRFAPRRLKLSRSSFPLHPEVLETLTGKTATLGNFQRVRGNAAAAGADNLAALGGEARGRDCGPSAPHRSRP